MNDHSLQQQADMLEMYTVKQNWSLEWGKIYSAYKQRQLKNIK